MNDYQSILAYTGISIGLVLALSLIVASVWLFKLNWNKFKTVTYDQGFYIFMIILTGLADFALLFGIVAGSVGMFYI